MYLNVMVLGQKTYSSLSFSVQQQVLQHGQKRSASVKAGVRGPGGGVGPGIDSLQAILSDKAAEGDEETIDNSNEDDDYVRTVTFQFK